MTHRLFLQTPTRLQPSPLHGPGCPCFPAGCPRPARALTTAPGSPGLEQDHPDTPGSWQADRWAPGLEQSHSIPGRPRGGAALPVAPTRPTGPSGLGRRLLAVTACRVGGVGATGERSQKGTILRGWGWRQAWRSPPSCCLGPPAGPCGLPGDSPRCPLTGRHSGLAGKETLPRPRERQSWGAPPARRGHHRPMGLLGEGTRTSSDW